MNGAYFAPYFHRARVHHGLDADLGELHDRPIAGDWNGDGKADVGVYRPTATSRRRDAQLRRGHDLRAHWGRPGRHAARR